MVHQYGAIQILYKRKFRFPPPRPPKMTENPSDRKKIQRSISATDAEWNLITRRAGSSHHSSRSEFLIDRALATSDESATSREPSSAVFRQMAVDIRTLVLFSEVQFRRMSPSSGWVSYG